MIGNSIKQLLRTPIKTLLFLLLILTAGMFLCLGCSLWIINNRNIEYYEKSFITIGTVEQRATSSKQVEWWNPYEKEYEIYQYPVYGKTIPSSVLDLEEAQYIQLPEKRPYYASYNPELKFDTKFYMSSVVEVIPQENGVPNQPVPVEIKKILSGSLFFEGQNIELYDETLVDPKPLVQGKTYVLTVYLQPVKDGDTFKDQYVPGSVILSRQYDSEGNRLPDELTDDELYYEVTEGFYDTEIGKRFLEYIKSIDQYQHSIPVTGTNATILLMPFYNMDAVIIQGRDITADEYEKGEKVCLVPGRFAKDQNLVVGDTINLKLYTADYRFAPCEYFDTGITAELNAKGEAYPVFEDSEYTIVGFYDMPTGAIQGSYGFAKNEVIIPSGSIKNSDDNNIISYGPMKSTTTSFQIPNGSTEEFMKAWGELGIEELEIRFYDRGYSKLKAGMDNMKNMSLTLAVVGLVMVVFILLFFSHLFIIKQVRRTAIERSLGMGRRKCMISLLSGLMLILLVGSVLGSSIGGAVSIWLSGQNVSNAYYSTQYSSGITDSEANNHERASEEDIPVVIRISILSMSLVILLGAGISIAQMTRNLRQEPMELLSRQKE